MRCTLLVSLLMILILTTSSKSDSITTGNLLPNVGDGVDWGSIILWSCKSNKANTISIISVLPIRF